MSALSLLEIIIAQVKTGTCTAPQRSASLQPRMAASSMPRASPPQGGIAAAHSMKFIDIGANMLDGMFAGEYRGKQAHPPDIDAILARAADAGVERLIVTAGSLEESKAAIDFVRAHRTAGSPVKLYSTVGVHPTRALEFLPTAERSRVAAAMEQLSLFTAPDSKQSDDTVGRAVAEAALTEAELAVLETDHVEAAIRAHTDALLEVITEGMAENIVVAVGECGLDYDRLFFCPAQVQQAGFKVQLELSTSCGLPLFLHNRNTGGDFATMMSTACAGSEAATGGVVHSFDGDEKECKALLALGLHIGLNGCSLRTPENLAMASQVPLDRLHLETDAPWCSIKRTHAGFAHVRPLNLSSGGGESLKEVKKEKWEAGACVKDRCEPCHIQHVLQVLAGSRLASAGSVEDETRGDGSNSAAEEQRVADAAYANSLRVFWPNE